MATPTVVDSVATNPGGTGSTIVPTLPTHAAGDVIEIFVGKTGNVTITAPANWTIKHQSTVGTSSNGLVGILLYRRVLSGDALPLPSPTITLGATVTRGAIALTKRGADIESVYNSPSWSATNTTTGTANPIRPPSVTTPAPEMLVHHYYCQRAATNAPEPTGYTEDKQIVISGTLVINVSEKNVGSQSTILSNQDASPTSGARWVGMIAATPSIDYPYYRSGSQATATGLNATPTKPTGTTNSDQRGSKDVMIATVEAAGSPEISPTDFDLWQEIFSWAGLTDGNGTIVKKFWCYATASPNMQFNRETSGEISVCVTTYYNCHQSSLLGNSDADPRASSTTSTWDAITRGSSKSLVQATCVADGTPSFTSPTGWTERMDGLGIVCSDQTYAIADVTGADSFTLSTASPTRVGLVEIRGLASVSDAGLTISVSDSAANLSDSLIVGHGQVIADNAGNLADAHTKTLEYHEVLADDAANLADAHLEQLGVAVTTTDSFTLSDSLILGNGLAATDALLVSDAHAELLSHQLSPADAIAFIDSGTQVLSHLLFFADTNTLTDFQDLILGHLIVLSESVGNFVDSTSLQIDHLSSFSDTIAVTDLSAQVLAHLLTLSDDVNQFADSAVIDLQSVIAEQTINVSNSLSLTDDFTQVLNYQLPFADTVTLTDTHAQTLSQSLAFVDDANTLADALNLILSQLASFADSADNLIDLSQLQLDHLLLFGDAVILTDSESQAFSYLTEFSDDANNLADDVALDLQGVTDERTVNVQDSLTLTDGTSLNLHHQLSLDDAIVLSDESALQQEQLAAFTDALTFTDATAFILHYLLLFTDTLILTDDASIDSSAREQSLTDSLNQQDSVALVLGHWISTDDGLQQVDSVVVVSTGPERLVSEFDSLANWTDEAVLDVGEIGGYELVFTDSLVLTDHEFLLRGPYTPSQKRKTVVPLRARATVVPKRERETVV